MNHARTERLCEVATVDASGKRHVMQAMATSTYRAACCYYATACTDVAAGLPQPDWDTIYEVQVVGEERVYRFTHRKMMDWANREAERNSRTG